MSERDRDNGVGGGFSRLLLERAPQWLLAVAARRLDAPKRVERVPGWYFDMSETDRSASTNRRREIWRTFESRRIRQPVRSKWYGDTTLDLYLGNDLSKCIYVGLAFEPNEFALLDELLGPGMTFIDVGANEGAYAVFAAEKVGSEGNVVAVEPSLREFRRLTHNLALNEARNTQPLHVAVGASAGTTRIAIAGYGHEGQNTVGDTVSNRKVETIGTEEVRIETLDGIVSRLALERVDFVKVDTEGSEADVLRGARTTLRDLRPVVQLEVAEDALRAKGAAPVDLAAMLDSSGYRTWVFDDVSGRLREGPILDATPGNVIAAPDGWRPP